MKVNILWSTIVLRMLLSIFYCHHIAQYDAHTESERHIKQNKVDSDNTPPPGLVGTPGLITAVKLHGPVVMRMCDSVGLL